MQSLLMRGLCAGLTKSEDDHCDKISVEKNTAGEETGDSEDAVQAKVESVEDHKKLNCLGMT